MKFAAFPAVLALAAVSTCVPAIAKANPPAAQDQASTAHQDTEFLKKANQGNVDEIDLAQLALQKAKSQDVKDFAQKMIDDHTKLMEDMKPFATEAGLETPTHPDASTEAQKMKLDVLSGERFDKAYIKDMVEDHHKDLEEFRAEVKSTGYPAFKSAVEKGEQVIREHLELADGLAKKNGIAPAPIPPAGI